jgi:hypothetical protein
VPDLGLDESGRLTLDFGPRAFHVRFDDALTPFVVDGDGKRLKDLPKPNAKDDPVRAKEAVSRYKDFKKQAKSVTGVQVKRLETAMCARRRWNGDDFMRLFVHHAFARHLSRRLIWGLYDEDDRCIDAFRVAEDRTLADVEDREYRLPAAARIGIAHPLDFGGDLLERCARLLADYEIVQVFPQLGRETFVLTEAAATQRDLPEWPGRRVTVGSLLGIEQRGWRRRVGDGGMIDGFVLAKPNGRRVELAFAPGWFVGEAPPVKDVQEISGVALQGENARWDQFTPVEFSEMQRDLHLMAWFTGP